MELLEEEIKILEVIRSFHQSLQLVEVVDQDMITEQTQLEDLVVLDQEVEVDLLEQLVKEMLEVALTHLEVKNLEEVEVELELLAQMDHLLVVEMVAMA